MRCGVIHPQLFTITSRLDHNAQGSAAVLGDRRWDGEIRIMINAAAVP